MASISIVFIQTLEMWCDIKRTRHVHEPTSTANSPYVI